MLDSVLHTVGKLAMVCIGKEAIIQFADVPTVCLYGVEAVYIRKFVVGIVDGLWLCTVYLLYTKYSCPKGVDMLDIIRTR